MRSRLRTRAALATLLVALLAAVWFGLSVALLPEPPVPREILLGGGGVCLTLFAIIGGLAIIEARALRRAEERMRRFLADASHELRTPIAGVQASAEILLRTDPGHAAREKLVLQILGEAHRAGRLVDDLLDMTRLEQGIPLAIEPFDLVPLTAAAVELTRELAPAVTIHLHAPGHSPLRGDPRRIRQVLDNILSNAATQLPKAVRSPFASATTTPKPRSRSSTRDPASRRPTGNGSSSVSPGWPPPIPAERTATGWAWRSPAASPTPTRAPSRASTLRAPEPASCYGCRDAPERRSCRPDDRSS